MWIFQFSKSKSPESKRPRISFFFYLFVSFVFLGNQTERKETQQMRG